MVNNWQLGKHTPINHWTWHFDCHTKLSPIIMFLYKPRTIIIKKNLKGKGIQEILHLEFKDNWYIG